MGGGGWRRIARRMKANGRCELCDVDASALSAVASQPDSGLPNADFRQNTRVRVGLKPAVTSPCVNVRTLVAHGEIIRRRYALLDVFRFARDALQKLALISMPRERTEPPSADSFVRASFLHFV